MRDVTRVIAETMPHNEQAEALVIATLIDHPSRFDAVADRLRPDDFYVNKHKNMYDIMRTFYREKGEAPDYMTLVSLLEERDGQYASDIEDVLALKDHLWSANLDQDVQLILGCSVQRQNIIASQKLATIGYSITDPDKGREAVESLLYGLTMNHAPQSDFESLEDILGECMQDADKAWKNRGTIQGIPTGFTDLDRMTGGLQRCDLILLAARPSMGKTALAMGMGYNAARHGFAVAVFSLEMGKKQLGLRLLSLRGGIPTNRIRSGWLEEEDFATLREATDHLGSLCIHIDDTSGSPISSIRSKLRRLKAKIKRPIDFVIVDYLGLMEPEDDTPTKRENRNQEIAQISRGLKGIAREFDVPVLALSQLSRAVEGRSSKIPQLSDLRDSGTLEQDADIVMFVYRDDYYAGLNADGQSNSNRPGTADIIVAKHRNGPTGEVSLAFNGALTRFDN